MSPWRDRLAVALAVVILGTTLVSAQPFGRPPGPGLAVVAGGGVGVTGTGTADRIAIWSGTSALTSDADFTFSGVTLSLAALGVIDWGAGDVTLTGGTNLLAIAGGQFRHDNGTAALPSYSFTNCTNCGMFTDGDFLGFSTDGVAQMYLNSNLVRPGTTGVVDLGGTSTTWNNLYLGRTGSDAKVFFGTGTAQDASFSRVAVGGFAFADEANGKAVNIKQATELTTIAAAATTDTTIEIPANSLVIAVTVRVTTVIPTAATFDIGVVGATTRYGTGISTAANTTNSSPGTTNPTIYGTAAKIRFTPNATPADTTGRVRTTIYYIDATAPTS